MSGFVKVQPFSHAPDDLRHYHKAREWAALRPIGIHNVINYYPEPEYDRWGTMTVGEWGGYLIQIIPLIYSDRLILTRKDTGLMFEYGWEYQKGPAACLAALVWNPITEAEPIGFLKRLGPPRTPGQTAPVEPGP